VLKRCEGFAPLSLDEWSGGRIEFFLNSSKGYRPSPCNVSDGNPQPRIFIDKK
jgi:hypothetical protein